MNTEDKIQHLRDIAAHDMNAAWAIEAIEELENKIETMREILHSDSVSPDLDDYPNVRDMSRDELAKALLRDARQCCIYKTRERKIRSLLSENSRGESVG